MKGVWTSLPTDHLLKLMSGRCILHRHVIVVRKEMTGRPILRHNVRIHLNRMIVHQDTLAMMTDRAILQEVIHKEVIHPLIAHHKEKVLRKEKVLLHQVVVLRVEAVAVDIHQVVVVPVILPEDQAILQAVLQDQAHLQEAGDNSINMI